MTHLLDPDVVIRMNHRTAVGHERRGLNHGGRELLEAALGRPTATFLGDPLYPRVVDKAGALMHSLATAHPFFDGNKRTNVMATGFYLLSEGITLDARRIDIAQFVRDLARDGYPVEVVTEWIERHLVYLHSKSRPTLM